MKENRFWFLTILMLFALARVRVAEEEEDDSPAIDDEISFCGGVTDVSGELPPAPATGKFPEADPSTYRPFRFLYILVDNWTETERAILNKAFEEVNNRIGPIVRGPRLSEVRLRRSNESECATPTCVDEVPRKYALPCTLENDTVADESESYAEYNKDAKYSVVVFIISAPHTDCQGPEPPIAFASICQRGERNRPTHGRIVICKKLTSEYFVNDRLQNMLLHESLHIVIGDFDGHHFPSNPLVEQGEQNETAVKEEARGKSFKWITLNWKTNDSNIERKVPVSMTPNVLTYIQDEHFRCDAVEGAELSIVEGEVDAAHWSFRLFPDEIMSRQLGDVSRLSKLTLSSMLDSTWYSVNMRLAEPLIVSRPQADGCSVAQKSCYELQLEFVNKSTDLDEEVFLGHPYCYEKSRVISSLCSSDNKARLACRTFQDTFNCSIRVGIVEDKEPEYGHVFCQFAKAVPAQRLKDKGLRAGNGTMCVTFVDTEWAPPPDRKKKRVYPGCVAYTCDEGQLVLQFHRENKSSCNITLRPGIHENTIVQDPFPSDDECAKLLSPIKLIGPTGIATLCPWDDVKAAMQTEPSDACGDNASPWRHIVMVSLVAICKLIKI